MTRFFQKWFFTPTRKQAIMITCAWFFGLVLLIIAATNFFTESPFKKENLPVGLLVLFSASTVIIAWKNSRGK